MDISKDGTRLEEFLKLIDDNDLQDLVVKISINVKNPSIYKDFLYESTFNDLDGIILSKYAYAANLITKDEWKFIISEIANTHEGETAQEPPGVLGPPIQEEH